MPKSLITALRLSLVPLVVGALLLVGWWLFALGEASNDRRGGLRGVGGASDQRPLPPPPWRGQSLPSRALRPGQAPSSDVLTGAPQTVDLPSAPTALFDVSLRVRILDDRGVGVAGARVRLLALDGSGPPAAGGRRGARPVQEERSDARGYALLQSTTWRGVPLGIEAIADGFAPAASGPLPTKVLKGGSYRLKLGAGLRWNVCVVDEAGQALPGTPIEVRVEPSLQDPGLPSYRWAARADDAGCVAFEGLLAAPLSVLVGAEQGVRRRIEGLVLSPGMAARPAEVVLPSAAGRGSVRVVSRAARGPAAKEEALAVAGAMVTLIPLDSTVLSPWSSEAGASSDRVSLQGRIELRGFTDTRGEVVLPLVGSGPHTVTASLAGYRTAQGDLLLLAQRDEVVLELHRTASVVGVVEAPQWERGPILVTAWATDPAGRPVARGPASHWLREGPGPFRLEGLPPGGWILEASAPGQRSAWSAPLRVDRGQAGELAGTPQHSGIRLRLSSGLKIVGRLVDGRGDGVPGVALSLSPGPAPGPGSAPAASAQAKAGAGRVQRGTSSASGHFVFVALAPGQYELSGKGAEMIPFEREGIVLPAGSSVVDLGAVTVQRGARLHGRVLDAEGRPLGGRLLRATQEDPRRSVVTSSDAEGSFALQGLHPGDWTVQLAGTPLSAQLRLAAGESQRWDAVLR